MKAYARPHFHGWGYRLFLIWGASGRKWTQRIFRSMYSGWLISGPQCCWLSIWKCGRQSRFSCSSWAHSHDTSCHYCRATAQDTLTPAEVHCGKGTVSSSLRSSADLSLILDNICTIGTRIYLTFLFLFTSMGYYKSTAYLMCPTKALVPSAVRDATICIAWYPLPCCSIAAWLLARAHAICLQHLCNKQPLPMGQAYNYN